MPSPLPILLNSVWKKIKKPLLIIAAGFVVLLLTAIIIGKVYEKEITGYFLEKINTRLNTQVEIGEITFSLLDNFPDATVSIRNVKAAHSKPFKGAGNLMTAEEIDFRFSLVDLFGESYSVKQIDVANGAVNILRNADNLINYQLLKEDSSAGKGGGFSFTLNALTVKNVNILVRDDVAGFSALFLANSGNLKGNFTDTDYALGIEGDFQVSRLSTGKTTWLSNRPLTASLDLQVNSPSETYKITKGKLHVADLEIAVDGTVKNADKTWLELKLKGEEMDIRSVLSLLPPEYDEKIKGYKSDGEFYGEALIKGNWSDEDYPFFQLDFGIKHAKISQRKEDVHLENVNLTGRFSNGSGHSLTTSVLQLEKVSMVLGNGKLKGNFRISNFSDPDIRTDVVASVNLEILQKFINLDPVYALRGNANLNLHLAGRERQLKNYNSGGLGALTAEGYLTITDAALSLAPGVLKIVSR